MYGVDGEEPPQIDEQPVAFAMYILSPNSCVDVYKRQDFYSSNDITEIGSFYLRAAKSNGTVGLDNLTMVCE